MVKTLYTLWVSPNSSAFIFCLIALLIGGGCSVTVDGGGGDAEFVYIFPGDDDVGSLIQ